MLNGEEERKHVTQQGFNRDTVFEGRITKHWIDCMQFIFYTQFALRDINTKR